MSIELYLTYVLACFLFAIIPGPIITLIVANSLTHGMRPAFANIAGAQVGLGVMIGIVLLGLASIIETMGWWFDWLRLAGAAYLVWLGIRLVRATGTPATGIKPAAPRGGFFLQGFLVLMSNPKALLFFGAFIPQFVDPHGDYVAQVVLLGVTVMAVTVMCDSVYVTVSSRSRALFSRTHTRLASRIGGAFLIGGGIWLALARAK